MEINLTPDQESFVRHAVASGRFKNAEDAIQEALFLWKERERQYAESYQSSGRFDWLVGAAGIVAMGVMLFSRMRL